MKIAAISNCKSSIFLNGKLRFNGIIAATKLQKAVFTIVTHTTRTTFFQSRIYLNKS